MRGSGNKLGTWFITHVKIMGYQRVLSYFILSAHQGWVSPPVLCAVLYLFRGAAMGDIKN